jgi:hypothetical protein
VSRPSTSRWAPDPADPAALTDPVGDSTIASLAGIAWLLAAAVGGYVAVLQWQGQPAVALLAGNGLRAMAVGNSVGALFAAFFGVRCHASPSRAFLSTMTAWALLSVTWTTVQVTNGASHWLFLVIIAISILAGGLSFLARGVAAGDTPPSNRRKRPPPASPPSSRTSIRAANRGADIRRATEPLRPSVGSRGRRRLRPPPTELVWSAADALLTLDAGSRRTLGRLPVELVLLAAVVIAVNGGAVLGGKGRPTPSTPGPGASPAAALASPPATGRARGLGIPGDDFELTLGSPDFGDLEFGTVVGPDGAPRRFGRSDDGTTSLELAGSPADVRQAILKLVSYRSATLDPVLRERLVTFLTLYAPGAVDELIAALDAALKAGTALDVSAKSGNIDVRLARQLDTPGIVTVVLAPAEPAK